MTMEERSGALCGPALPCAWLLCATGTCSLQTLPIRHLCLAAATTHSLWAPLVA